MSNYDWQVRDGLDLYLPATDTRPAMVVYYMVSRKWCWNTYGGLDKRLPDVSETTGLLSRDTARWAAEAWLDKYFGSDGVSGKGSAK